MLARCAAFTVLPIPFDPRDGGLGPRATRVHNRPQTRKGPAVGKRGGSRALRRRRRTERQYIRGRALSITAWGAEHRVRKPGGAVKRGLHLPQLALSEQAV